MFPDLTPLKWLIIPAIWVIPAAIIGGAMALLLSQVGAPFGITYFAIMILSIVCGFIHAAICE